MLYIDSVQGWEKGLITIITIIRSIIINKKIILQE